MAVRDEERKSPADVVDNPAANRFELEVGGDVAVLEYAREGGRLLLVHTEVPEALEGRGYASVLARAALDQAKAKGLKVVPMCPFVRAYLRRHHEYDSIVQQSW